eukprot:gene10189-8100_t
MLPIENSLNEFPCALLVTLDILDHDCMPCSGDLASSCLLPHSPPRTAKPRSHERTSASSLASPQLPPFAVPSPANTHERTSAPAAPPTSACRLSHPPVRRSCEYDRSSMSSPPGPRTFHPRLSSTFPPPRPPIRNSSPGQTLLILGPNIDETDFTPYSDFTPPPSVFMTVDSWGSTEMQYLGDPDVRRHALGRSRLSSTQNSNHVDPLDSLLELSSSNRSDRSRLPSHGRLEGCSVTASSTRSSQYRGTWHRIMTLNAAREMANREEKRKASGSSGHSFRSSPSRSPLPRSPPPRSPPSRSPNPQKPDPSNLKGVLGMSVASCQGQYRWSSVCQQLNQMTAARRISKPNKFKSAASDQFKRTGSDQFKSAASDHFKRAGPDQFTILNPLEPTGQATGYLPNISCFAESL